MSRIFNLQKNFFKKNLKDILSFAIILLVSTVLLVSSFVINLGISQAYDAKHEELNTANAFFTFSSSEYQDELLDDIKQIQNVAEAEAKKGILMTISVEMEGSPQDQNVIFYNFHDGQKINQFSLVTQNHGVSTPNIYLTNYTYIHSGLNQDDMFKFTIGDQEYLYNIGGVIEEMQYGNYSSSIIAEYLDEVTYQDFLELNPDKEVVTISVRGDNSEALYNDISKYLSQQNINVFSKNYDAQSKTQRLAIANILVLIITAFSLLILIVSLLVSKFKITESIEQEIANMGVLKALGYTSNEIITSVIAPYLMTNVVVSIAGILLSTLVTPVLAKVVEMQSGFIWQPGFDLKSYLLVFLINFMLVLIFALVSAHKIKKLNPINAIRGIETNKPRKNHFEIDKTKGNIELVLIFKNFVYSLKQNLLLGIVIFFITIVSSFVGILYYNVNANPMNFINTLVEEHPSVIVEAESDIKNELKELDNVKNVIYYDETQTVNFKDNSYKTFISEDYQDLANDLCYEGHNPETTNEITVGSSIKEKFNLKLDDDIEISKGEVSHKFKIVGFVQSVNYSGEIFELTMDGYKTLDAEYAPRFLYVYLNDESLASDFVKQAKQNFGDEILNTTNYVESMDGASAMYISLVSAICVIIAIVAALLVYLVLYIIISSIILSRKQELGIFKAIGYKSSQLVNSVVGGLLPSVIVATVIGVIVSRLCIDAMFTTIFSTVGAYKISFIYPLAVFIMLGCIIAISATIIGLFLSRRIKKISVYSLIKE